MALKTLRKAFWNCGCKTKTSEGIFRSSSSRSHRRPDRHAISKSPSICQKFETHHFHRFKAAIWDDLSFSLHSRKKWLHSLLGLCTFFFSLSTKQRGKREFFGEGSWPVAIFYWRDRCTSIPGIFRLEFFLTEPFNAHFLSPKIQPFLFLYFVSLAFASFFLNFLHQRLKWVVKKLWASNCNLQTQPDNYESKYWQGS